MGCLKGKKKNKPVKGTYRCRKCGGISKDKGDICKPEKIKDDENCKCKKKKKK